jgi:hypothetical protein
MKNATPSQAKSRFQQETLNFEPDNLDRYYFTTELVTQKILSKRY